jgi:hypothetical protein
MALLSVCEHCAFYIGKRNENIAQDLHSVLKLAEEMAGEIHEELEAAASKSVETVTAQPGTRGLSP